MRTVHQRIFKSQLRPAVRSILVRTCCVIYILTSVPLLHYGCVRGLLALGRTWNHVPCTRAKYLRYQGYHTVNGDGIATLHQFGWLELNS